MYLKCCRSSPMLYFSFSSPPLCLVEAYIYRTYTWIWRQHTLVMDTSSLKQHTGPRFFSLLWVRHVHLSLFLSLFHARFPPPSGARGHVERFRRLREHGAGRRYGVRDRRRRDQTEGPARSGNLPTCIHVAARARYLALADPRSSLTLLLSLSLSPS